MWDGYLCIIDIAEHHIKLEWKAQHPFSSTALHAASIARNFETQKVVFVTDEKITDEAQIEWATYIWSALKKDGFLRIRINYGKLYGVIVRDLYSVLYKENCKDILEDA